MKPFDYAMAKHLKGAVAAVGAGWTPKAGGIDLLDRLKERLETPQGVVSLAGVPELSRLVADQGNLVVGANLTLASIASAPLVKQHLHGLAEAAGDAATPQVRAVATLGGNLLQRTRCEYFRQAELACLKRGAKTCGANTGDNEMLALFGGDACRAVHASNLAPVLVAAGAKLVVAGSSGLREVPAADFFVYDASDLNRESVLAPGDVLVEAHIPLGVTGSAWREVRRRRSFDWPLAGCAVVRRDTSWGVAFGGVAPTPWPAQSVASAAASGSGLTAALDKLLDSATPTEAGRYRVKLLRQAVIDAVDAVNASSAGNKAGEGR